MIKIYGIKNCGSVKKALDFLNSHALKYEFIDFKKTPPSYELLNTWLQNTSIELLFNKKGTTYKKLNLKELSLDDEAIKEYLIKEPMLIKRPVIKYPNGVLVGFDEEIYKKKLL
ncbi:arsenate reductase family protein [Helicobacter valdiviensis]|uniref:Arsenate reductase family protein n=1 Tax=Helicobacter valdiviensis TaxID=1458358 RepID=A0A2W6PQW4_9HELI|nr:arsenate reductase family protein [Helicobacter valdiviensis]PZT49143.1 arsenate reductase family protein [Helicobacter valdiviensis]